LEKRPLKKRFVAGESRELIETENERKYHSQFTEHFFAGDEKT